MSSAAPQQSPMRRAFAHQAHVHGLAAFAGGEPVVQPAVGRSAFDARSARRRLH
jgi:hypothetical protein